MSRCPSREQLALLLAEQLACPQAGAVEAHVQTCARCQEALDELSRRPATEAPRPGAKQEPTMGEEPASAFLHRLREAVPATTASPESAMRSPEHSELRAGHSTLQAPGAEEWPQVVGYEVLGVLGRGGMGVVYRARQLGLGRIVALKRILHAEYAGPEARRRFQAEAESIARLHHPHIVQIHEVGEAGGLAFFSLEYCGGGSLEERLDGTPWEAQRAARLIETLAGAVAAAHAAGIIHRDLKPGNVLLSEDGTPKVADFGLAKRLDVPGQTQTGAVVGTPSYMAPEQAGGKKDVGPPADVYALGILLYELLVGRPPFRAATPLDTVLQVLSEEPVPVRRLQPGVPKDLETICHKCLEKDPKKRYASAAALAEDLRRFGAGEPVAARPVGGVGRSVRWARRRPAMVALLALVAVAAAAGLVGIQWAHEKKRSEEMARLRDEAETNREEAITQRGRAEAQELLAQRLLYLSDMSMADRAWREGQHRLMLDLLERHNPKPGRPDLRAFEWYYLNRFWVYPNQVALNHHLPIEIVVFSPDGRWLATAGMEPGVRVWEVTTGRRFATLWDDAEEVTCVAFSPDGGSLFYGGVNGTVKVFNMTTLQPPRTMMQLSGTLTGLTFSADGTRMAGSRLSRKGKDHVLDVVLWDARTGREERVINGPWSAIERLTLAPNGSRLGFEALSPGKPQSLIVCNSNSVSSTNAPGGNRVLDLQWNLPRNRGLAFTTDGTSLAAACSDGTVQVWDLNTGREPMRLRGHTLGVLSVAFSPDGHRLASGSEDSTVKVWDRVTGQEVITLTGHQGAVGAIGFSADGSRLATGSDDSSAIIWDASALPPKPTADEARVIDIRTHMMEPILFRGFEDPKMTFADALDGIGRFYHVAFEIDPDAFSAEQTQNLLGTEVVRPDPIPEKYNRSLEVLLRTLLSRVRTNITFFVDGNNSTIVITTPEKTHDRVTTPVLENDTGQEQQVREHMLQTITFKGFDDPKITLGDALDFLSKFHGLKFEVDEEAFRQEGVMDVLRTEICKSRPLPEMKTHIHRLLNHILHRVPCRSGCSYLIRGDSIVVLSRAKRQRILDARLAKAAGQDKRAREELRFTREKHQPAEDLWAQKPFSIVAVAYHACQNGGNPLILMERLLDSKIAQDAVTCRWAFRRALTIATRYTPSQPPSYYEYWNLVASPLRSERLSQDRYFANLATARATDERILAGFRRVEKVAAPKEREEYQRYIDHLDEEIRLCIHIPRAMENETFALGQPRTEAARLLYVRICVMGHRNPTWAAASVRTLLDLSPEDPENLYRAAKCYALCMRWHPQCWVPWATLTVGTWPGLPQAEGGLSIATAPAVTLLGMFDAMNPSKTQEQYGALAVELLAKALKRGYAPAIDARTDTVFGRIWNRPDFQKLFRELEEKKGGNGTGQ
jgi:WD40 repeat protein